MKHDILLCNLTVQYGKKKIYIPSVVWKNIDGYYDRKRVLDKLKIKDKRVKVLSYDTIKVIGREN